MRAIVFASTFLTKICGQGGAQAVYTLGAEIPSPWALDIGFSKEAPGGWGS